MVLAVFLTASLVRAAAPSVGSVRGDSVALGENTLLHADVADADSDLDYVTFEVAGPGISGWYTVGSVNVSGSAASAQLAWTPSSSGIYTLKSTVHDLSGTATAQNTFEIFTGRRIVSNLSVGTGVARMIEDSGEIQTNQNLTSNEVTALNGGNLILWSGGRVVLKPGFRAYTGSFFWAAVDHDMDGYSDVEEATDTDGDGMFDAWEVDHGLNPIVNDASGDLDSDGFTNLQEFQQGTNPLVSNASQDGNSNGLPDWMESGVSSGSYGTAMAISNLSIETPQQAGGTVSLQMLQPQF